MKVISFLILVFVDGARVRRAKLNQLQAERHESVAPVQAEKSESLEHSSKNSRSNNTKETWAKCGPNSAVCCNPYLKQICPGEDALECQHCGDQEAACECPSESPSPSPLLSQSVLLVIDMQRDYCIGDACGDPVDTVSKWASEHTITVIQPIIDLMDKTKYDLVVFSQDSLKENEVCVENPDGSDWDDENKKCAVGSSLVTNTPGWEVIHALTDAAKSEFEQDQILFYTKNTDDVFNLLDKDFKEVDICTEPNCYPEAKDRKFDVAGDYDMPLSEVLKSRGFDTTNTHIDATGVLGNRCVMKSAIHIKHLGYDVSVMKAAVGVAQESENWYLTEEERKAGGTKHDLAQKPCPEPPCDASWYKEMYSGYRGGPAGDQVWEYLESANVEITE